jgi:hypothetical protein
LSIFANDLCFRQFWDPSWRAKPDTALTVHQDRSVDLAGPVLS